MSTICYHSSRAMAFLQAVARPKFSGPRSASVTRSQVRLGLPSPDPCEISSGATTGIAAGLNQVGGLQGHPLNGS